MILREQQANGAQAAKASSSHDRRIITRSAAKVEGEAGVTCKGANQNRLALLFRWQLRCRQQYRAWLWLRDYQAALAVDGQVSGSPLRETLANPCAVGASCAKPVKVGAGKNVNAFSHRSEFVIAMPEF